MVHVYEMSYLGHLFIKLVTFFRVPVYEMSYFRAPVYDIWCGFF